MRFAGVTLWDEGDRRHWPSVDTLSETRADVVVTHFGPPPLALVVVAPTLWVHGHNHHGHSDRQDDRTRVVRNAASGPNEPTDAPAVLDLVVKI